MVPLPGALGMISGRVTVGEALRMASVEDGRFKMDWVTRP